MIDNKESLTAKICALSRAIHSNKSRNKIFDDYLAYDMMGKEEYDSLSVLLNNQFVNSASPYPLDSVEHIINSYFAPITLSRIHFCEERLTKFVKNQPKVQYVICGAGSDTFSFRNSDPTIEIFEIDHPDTQLYKKKRLKSLEWNIPQNLHFVPIDFEKEKMADNLLLAGFDPNVKTFFSILGVTYYLTLPVFCNTLLQISELSAKDSVLVFDYPEKNLDVSTRITGLAQITKSLGEEMQGGYYYEEISRALYSLGFQIDTFLNSKKIEERYFLNRMDGLHAFEYVNYLSATYTGGVNFE